MKKDLRFVYFSMSHKYVCHITMYVTYVCQTSVCHISKSEQHQRICAGGSEEPKP